MNTTVKPKVVVPIVLKYKLGVKIRLATKLMLLCGHTLIYVCFIFLVLCCNICCCKANSIDYFLLYFYRFKTNFMKHHTILIGVA